MSDPKSPEPTARSPLDSVGWSDRVAALFASAETAEAGGAAARVVRVDRDRCTILLADGAATAAGTPLPAVGDWVVVTARPSSDPPYEVAQVLPRWSALTRHSTGQATIEQVLAANDDIVAVMTSLDTPISHSRLDRELVLAWQTGARPVVILTKADRCTDPESEATEVFDRHAGIDVVVTSAVDGTGIPAVASRIKPGETVVLLGASGVGKSTLANALLGRDELDTGPVRTGDQKGRHTTISRHLLALPGGGVLIDTPGLRSLGLYEAEEGIGLAFPDIEELIGQCRFANCSHTGDAGCAVAAAVEDGSLARERVTSWEKLQREMARVAVQRDGRALAERRKKERAFARSIRKLPHH